MSVTEAPDRALAALAGQLRADGTLLSQYVVEPPSAPALGALVAAGPAAASDPATYAQVIEAVREGYLLHYAQPRVLAGLDDDLALLAGDYLYALGLERLATVGNQEAVRELSDLIALSAQIHAEPKADRKLADSLWIASATAIATGSQEPFSPLKQAVRDGALQAADALVEFSRGQAASAGISDALSEASRSIQSAS